jgi:hypothetical protein
LTKEGILPVSGKDESPMHIADRERSGSPAFEKELSENTSSPTAVDGLTQNMHVKLVCNTATFIKRRCAGRIMQ